MESGGSIGLEIGKLMVDDGEAIEGGEYNGVLAGRTLRHPGGK